MRAEQPGGGRPLPRLAASVRANLAHAGPLTASESATIEGLQPLTRVLNGTRGAAVMAVALAAAAVAAHPRPAGDPGSG
ncbi:hypothetical protein [Nocardia brasiliensis]|uniref:hypothetical protein n=1 Tax=Nocardia brasiliensis TaxID=37326 RepID=UPI001931A690|nr:hypothetical protein [Nocardia brasiliensis]